MKHPAPFSNNLIPVIAKYLQGKSQVLDMFAGSGKLAEIRKHGFTGEIICNELEREWAESSAYFNDVRWIFGDARRIPMEPDSVEAIATSPCYGNRMADCHDAKDGSKRTSYKHCLGRNLTAGSAGGMQWGSAYQDFHIEAWQEGKRLLKPEGILIVNCSDHVRKGKIISVVAWHEMVIKDIGFTLIANEPIPTKRYGFGQNSKLRVSHENVMVFSKL